MVPNGLDEVVSQQNGEDITLNGGCQSCGMVRIHAVSHGNNDSLIPLKQALPFSVFQSFFFLLMLPE